MKSVHICPKGKTIMECEHESKNGCNYLDHCTVGEPYYPDKTAEKPVDLTDPRD
jgi:hypothetical protein